MAEDRLSMHLYYRGKPRFEVPMSTTLEETDNEVFKLCVQKLVEKAVLNKLPCLECELILLQTVNSLTSKINITSGEDSAATILYLAYEYEVTRVFVSTNPVACRLLGDSEQVLDPYDSELTFDNWLQEDEG